MVGGLLLSQVLTLYTTPVIYLYLDRLQHWLVPGRRSRLAAAGGEDGRTDGNRRLMRPTPAIDDYENPCGITG